MSNETQARLIDLTWVLFEVKHPDPEVYCLENLGDLSEKKI